MTKAKKILLILLLLAMVLAGMVIFLFSAPRLMQVRYIWDYHSWDELVLLAFAGTPEDRAEAQSVLDFAEQAFSDCTHTQEENQEAYGLLARYATSKDYNALGTSLSLELWSAHLGNRKGALWVFYSNEAYDSQGNTVRGSWGIPSLWRVTKDASGTWVVTDIKEHP